MHQINGINIFADINTPVIQKAINQFCDFKSGHEDVIVNAAILPDAHFGYGVPVGSVFAAKGMIFPSAVGFDQGCGMCAIKTSFDKQSVLNNSRHIWNKIQELIPTGFDHHDSGQAWSDYDDIEKTDDAVDIFNYKNGTGWRQLGTLGGGNHFIEVGADKEDAVWVIIHSGSRGIGHAIATHYMKIAGGGKAREGYYGLDVNTVEASNYIMDLNFALEFALANRKLMMERIEVAMSAFCDGHFYWNGLINRNHNHAELRDGLWIHRKGATHAEEGMMGVIPGNMRDGSFIVRGKGNPDSLWSSSHGAGRVLGRKQAKEQLNMEDFTETMGDIVAHVDQSRLDESPFAYKDIFKVMEAQKDLVEIVAYVKPLINVKG